MMSQCAMHTRWNLVSTSQFGTELSSSISTSPIIIIICKMPVKKYKLILKNAGSGNVVILSSTSHYTARGLVEKWTVSKHSATSSLEKPPSKSPQKPTNDLTPSGGLDYNQAMLEPLSLPQSKVGPTLHHDHTLWSLNMFVWFISLQSQNDYLREYLDKRNFYLAQIIASEGGLPQQLCIMCGMSEDWRCTDCLGHPTYCRNCCRLTHANTPFHWVQR